MASDHEVRLFVNNQIHEGWKQVSVRSSIEELSHSFTVEYSQRWSPNGTPVAIDAGDDVVIRIGDSLVLTGYVDESSESYDANTHTVSVQGRSRTADLIDCAAVYKSGSITGKNLLQIAEALCEPFGIWVTADPLLDLGESTTLQIQDGQSVFEALSELARKDGVLLLSDTAGNLVLSRASSAPKASLELRTGGNIKRGSVRSSFRDRFSEYLMKGQTPARKGQPATNLKYALADTGVTRYRPFVTVDHDATMERLIQRATWERNTRAGRAMALTYDVQGWSNAYGLWQPNTLLRVIDTTLGIDADLLVTTVDLERTLDSGRIARLELQPRETFDVLKPPKPPKRKKKGKAAPVAGL